MPHFSSTLGPSFGMKEVLEAPRELLLFQVSTSDGVLSQQYGVLANHMLVA